MKYAVIGKQAHTFPFAVEVSDKAVTADSMVQGFEPMFFVDFDGRSVQRLVRDEDGEFELFDSAYDSIGKFTTPEQLREMSEQEFIK